MSHLLSEHPGWSRPLASERSGATVLTDRGGCIEIAGGAHASCIVHDAGSILNSAFERVAKTPLPCTSRAVRHVCQEELASRIVQMYGDCDSRVYFTSGGTEAIETAVRLACHLQMLRGNPHASIVVGRTHSYHGMSVLSRNVGHHPIHSNLSGPLNFGWPKLPEPDRSECQLGCGAEAHCTLACADILEDIIHKSGQGSIAAVIVEPIAGTTGAALVPERGYLERLAEICRRYRILLIADETVTAFGRAGTAFESSRLADIVVGGKCLGGGLAPINAVILSGAIIHELSRTPAELPLRLTFSGNPLSCAIGSATQDYVERLGLLEKVRENGSIIAARFQELMGERGLRGRLRGQGHLWSLGFRVGLEDGIASLDCMRRVVLGRGLEFMGGMMRAHAAASVHVMFTPAFDIQKEELEMALQATVSAVAAAQDEIDAIGIKVLVD